MSTSEMSTGKTLLVLSIVMGCFAVLWPKIFYPMFYESSTAAKSSSKSDSLRHDRLEYGHPALRAEHPRPLFPGEEGRTLRRTIEKDLKPGPIPGMRPNMGGPGLQPQAHPKAQGPMAILMPLYTVGIVIFFVYTVLKIIFKKKDEEEESSEAFYSQHPSYPPRIRKPVRESSMRMAAASTPAAPASPILLTAQKVQDLIQAAPDEDRGTATASPPTIDPRDEEIVMLKKRLEETERAMLQIVQKMSSQQPVLSDSADSTSHPDTSKPRCQVSPDQQPDSGDTAASPADQAQGEPVLIQHPDQSEQKEEGKQRGEEDLQLEGDEEAPRSSSSSSASDPEPEAKAPQPHHPWSAETERPDCTK